MFNECLEIRWKTGPFCNLNFSFYTDFVWDVISSIGPSVSSPNESPRSSSKILLRVVFYTLFSVFHLVMKHCVSCLIYYFIVVLRTWTEDNAHTIMGNVKMVNEELTSKWSRTWNFFFFFRNKLVSPGMAIFPFTVRLNQQPRATYPSCSSRRAALRNQTGVNTFEQFVHFL